MLAGKLNPPWTRPTAVSRRRLLGMLDDALTPVTVVIGPAGWGKTTLLAQWAGRDAGRPLVAWVTLDETDNDPVRFWTYVITALQRARPGVGAEAMAALRVPGLEPLDVAVPSLINDLTAHNAQRVVVLVLDDYHLITDRRIHEAAEFLLSYLSAAIRVLIAARFDPPLPLARLRARGQLTEIRAADLAFAPEEAIGLVADVGRVALGADQVAGLVDRTEGWAAGLHLAALALRGAADPVRRAEAIRGDDRHVVDYLGAEVLARLPPDQRHFLIRSSVLDRMTGPLCDAALDCDGSAERLDALERAGLFVVPLDEQREWYRYHRLFRAALRQELVRVAPDGTPGILRRAAAWWHAHGDVETAVRYLIAAGDQREAADLLIAADDEFLDGGAAATYLRLAEALDEALVRADPCLAIAMAAAAGFSGRADRADRLLDAAEAGLTGDDRPPRGWTSARAAIGTLRATFGPAAKLAAAVEEARRAVELEHDPTRDGYVISRLTLGVVLAGLDRQADALALLGAARRGADALGAPVFTRLIAAGALAMCLLDEGHVDDARSVVAESAPAAAGLEAALSDAAGGALALLRAAEGRLAYEAGRPDLARTTLERAARLARAAAHPSQTARVLVTLADALLATGDRAAARAVLAEAAEIAGTDTVFPGTLRRISAAEQRMGRGAARAARGDGRLFEELTDRELSMLRALQGPLSQREIGQELYLSLNTVKGYTRSLYRKLDVASRLDAVRRGRELGLI
ncbi:LuxR C-terminal-related transcriptional regulator [Nonomuraea sp. NPDC049709]|uniref:LuxR C-terminal-related transcriptional regulator n=1 Tax=Nonomuraea sp. NPDC049709 TaxID=3154736 RepID=UPI00342AF409